MRPTERSGYVPAVARVLFDAFPAWTKSATVTEEQSVTVTRGVRVSKPCLLIRIPSPVARPDLEENELVIDITDGETTVFYDHGHEHLTHFDNLSLEAHLEQVRAYIADLLNAEIIVNFVLDDQKKWRGTSMGRPGDYDNDVFDVGPLPPGYSSHTRSWTGCFDADRTNNSSDG